MANSELYGKEYKIPENILKSINVALINNPSNGGVKRAKNLIRNGNITYQGLKRLKNYFDYYNGDDKVQYELAGGDLMKSFVDKTLNSDRDGVERSKKIRQDITVNQKQDLKTFKPNPDLSLNEEKNKKPELQKNAIAVIINNDNKILLLKRSSFEKQWMPNKWGLVGGGIEKDESPKEACKREIKEETGLDINNFTDALKIQRKKDSIEHIFACKYDGDLTDITLNNENVSYGWFDMNEMSFLDTVPHLIEYITLVFKKYE